MNKKDKNWMKSKKSKMVHKLFGKELVSRVVDIAENVKCSEIITVVGEQIIKDVTLNLHLSI